MMQIDQNETITVVKQEMQMGWFSQAESVVYRSKVSMRISALAPLIFGPILCEVLSFWCL